MNVTLRKLKTEDIRAISQWQLSSIDLLFWANIHEQRSSLDQYFNKWFQDSDVTPYILELEGAVIGYGELWEEEYEVELARLIVSPDFRGKGFGKKLTLSLLGEAKNINKPVWLRVHPKNQKAFHLYQRIGFAQAKPEIQDSFNTGQPIPFIWMQLL